MNKYTLGILVEQFDLTLSAMRAIADHYDNKRAGDFTPAGLQKAKAKQQKPYVERARQLTRLVDEYFLVVRNRAKNLETEVFPPSDNVQDNILAELQVNRMKGKAKDFNQARDILQDLEPGLTRTLLFEEWLDAGLFGTMKRKDAAVFVDPRFQEMQIDVKEIDSAKLIVDARVDVSEFLGRGEKVRQWRQGGDPESQVMQAMHPPQTNDPDVKKLANISVREFKRLVDLEVELVSSIEIWDEPKYYAGMGAVLKQG